MKKVSLVIVAVLFVASFAMAQDVLGSHNLNGKGCVTCHAPHSGAKGNGGSNLASGNNYLWGRDFVAATYSRTPHGSTTPDTFTVAANSFDTVGDNVLFHTAACLSCHDGNGAPAGMTGNATNGAPSFLVKNDANGLQNDHPVHVEYLPNSGCTSPTATCSPYNWAGTIDATGAFTWDTTAGGATITFTNNYGRSIRFYAEAASGGATQGNAYVECSTCHNPHAQTKAKAKFLGASQVKPSAYFIRGWYDTSAGSNSTTQFCRQCHYSKSNEYLGVNNVTTN